MITYFFRILTFLFLADFRYENIISRTCYYAWYVLTRRIDSNYADVQNKVLQSPRVEQAIQRNASDEYHRLCHNNNNHKCDNTSITSSSSSNSTGSCSCASVANVEGVPRYQDIVEKHRRKAFNHLMRLRSCISSSLMRIAGWVLYRLLSRIFTSIQFNKAQIDRIRGYTKRSATNGSPIPVLYLPLHRSHLDYILISFILYMNNVNPPLVAAGDNLLIPFFGNLMRGLGAFFIKRPNSNKNQAHRDLVYQSILHSYIVENLREGNSLEFFMEGGRTRSGKVIMPKTGLLSIVVDALLEGWC